MPKPLIDESELLRQVGAGDQHAFRIVYDLYKSKIYTYSLSLLQSDILAEELMQEVFLKLWCRGKDASGVMNLEAYLKTIARNKGLDLLRKNLSLARVGLVATRNYTEAHNETEERIILNDTKQVLNEGVDLLTPQQREVYLLCHVEGLKYEAAAQRLGISTNTVKTHMKLALSFLRQHVRNHTDIAAIFILLKLF